MSVCCIARNRRKAAKQERLGPKKGRVDARGTSTSSVNLLASTKKAKTAQKR